MKKPVTPLGHAIRRERLKRYLSQRDVASLAKISTPTMNRIETCDHTPRPAEVVRLAECFDIPPAKWLRIALPDDYKIWERVFRAEVTL